MGGATSSSPANTGGQSADCGLSVRFCPLPESTRLRAQDQFQHSIRLLCLQARVESITLNEEVHISFEEGWDFTLVSSRNGPSIYEQPPDHDDAAHQEWMERTNLEEERWLRWVEAYWGDWMRSLNVGDVIELKYGFSSISGPNDALPYGTPLIGDCWLPGVLDGSVSPPVPVTPDATPVPTPKPTVPAPREVLPTVECSPKPCNTDYRPLRGHADWLEPPSITAAGEFSLTARVHDGHDLAVPSLVRDDGGLNVISTSKSNLHGYILPPDNSSQYNWVLEPGAWVAKRYRYKDRVLTVVAKIDKAAATHKGLEICLWTGGSAKQESYILDCVSVEQP